VTVFRVRSKVDRAVVQVKNKEMCQYSKCEAKRCGRLAVVSVRSQEVWQYIGRKAKRRGSIQGEKPRGVAVFRVRSQEVWLYSG
jgi:hypothetical protein